jgi:hypothetical protein
MSASDVEKNGTGFNKTAVILSGLAALLFLLAVTLFLQGGFRAAQAVDQVEKEAGPQDDLLTATQIEQQARLNETPRWLDEEQKTLVMPIDDAKARLLEIEQAKTATGDR